MKLSNISMNYGAQSLFADANLILKKGRKYGLVGGNGAGKTTLFNILTKQIEPTSGHIITDPSDIIGYLKQDQFLFHNEIIINVVIAGNQKLYDTMKKREKLLNIENLSDDEAKQIVEIETEFANLGGYNAHEVYNHQIEKIMEHHD